MKKISGIIVLIFFACTSVSEHPAIIDAFANELSGDRSADQIFEEYIQTAPDARPLVLDYINQLKRQLSRTKPNYKILTYTEARKKGIGFDLVLRKEDEVYFIVYSKDLFIPVRLGENGKITGLMMMKKGDVRYFL